MLKCDFNKVAKQIYLKHTSAWVFFCKFAEYFQKPFPRNNSGWLLPIIVSCYLLVTGFIDFCILSQVF